MKKRHTRWDETQQVIKNNPVNIPELVSGSSTQDVTPQRSQQQALKRPKQVRQYLYLIRGHGFTLIELLVVVLIIGILAAVALPQYQRAVEKARMTEAVINVRTIANAHQLYYLTHGKYVDATSMHKLDITIPGVENTQLSAGRIQTQYFVYSPNRMYGDYLALAQHLDNDGKINNTYYIFIGQNAPTQIQCVRMAPASSIQKKLCQELNSKGSL